MPTGTDFLVRRTDLRECRFVDVPVPDETELQPGQALLKVDCFAFTANNVTYGVVGEMMSYWSFFPAEAGWGRIPVWGFGDVLQSDHQDVAPGERFWGYFPMSPHLVVQPDHATPGGFVDAAPHRRIGVSSPVFRSRSDNFCFCQAGGGGIRPYPGARPEPPIVIRSDNTRSVDGCNASTGASAGKVSELPLPEEHGV
jgi:hypothetical protein